MENRLDQLFRNQLSKHQEEPSTQSWVQLQEMLTSKRRSRWVRRLAIAASMTVFVATAFFAHRFLTTVQTDPPIEIAESETGQMNDAGLANGNEKITQMPETAVQEKATEKQTAKFIESPPEAIQDLAVFSYEPAAKEKQSNVQTEVADVKVLAEAITIGEKTDMMDGEKTEESGAEANVSIEEEINDPVLAENTIIDPDTEITTIETEEKSLPKVQIVYKANKGSALVASSKSTIIDKGLNKLTEFSDEHLLTSDRKTKLRNTKNDLLALNFGKLLNKSNKEIEN